MTNALFAGGGAVWSERWHGLMDELGYDMRRGRSTLVPDS